MEANYNNAGMSLGQLLILSIEKKRTHERKLRTLAMHFPYLQRYRVCGTGCMQRRCLGCMAFFARRHHQRLIWQSSRTWRGPQTRAWNGDCSMGPGKQKHGPPRHQSQVEDQIARN
eukprot:3967740-Amphidinium_carterae.1